MDEKDELLQPIPKVGGPRVQSDGCVSTLRDRVCMTAAMLVLEPIFEADLPPEQYATVLGAMRNRRWSRWEGLG